MTFLPLRLAHHYLYLTYVYHGAITSISSMFVLHIFPLVYDYGNWWEIHLSLKSYITIHAFTDTGTQNVDIFLRMKI